MSQSSAAEPGESAEILGERVDLHPGAGLRAKQLDHGVGHRLDGAAAEQRVAVTEQADAPRATELIHQALSVEEHGYYESVMRASVGRPMTAFVLTLVGAALADYALRAQAAPSVTVVLVTVKEATTGRRAKGLLALPRK